MSTAPASTATSSIAARLEARSAATAAGSHTAVDNATVSSSNHLESTSFLTSFEERKRAMENGMSEIAQKKEVSSKDGAAEDATLLDSLKSKHAQLGIELANLSSSLASHAHLLPAYDLRTTRLQLTTLEDAYTRVGEMLIPRKKFQFRKKTVPRGQLKSTAGDAASASTATIAASSTTSEPLPPENPLTGFYHKSNLILIKSSGSVSAQDVMLTHLTDCVVFILDTPSALRCHNLVRCKVYCGPCTGSVLIYGSTDCQFHFAARQLRIHDTHRTRFNLFVISNPIIEHSDTTEFAKYNFEYPQLEEMMKKSGFEGKTSQHASVEDFNWLRAQQSPNWSAVAEDDASNKPVVLNEQHAEKMKNMQDDQLTDEKQQEELRKVLEELKINKQQQTK